MIWLTVRMAFARVVGSVSLFIALASLIGLDWTWLTVALFAFSAACLAGFAAWSTAITFVELAEVNDRLRLTADIDQQTGLYHHAAFMARFSALLKESAGKTTVLMVGDIDNFKLINDTHGHQVGDKVISNASRLLREQFGSALIGRLGGEEFAVVLTFDRPAEAGPCEHIVNMADQWRRNFAATEIVGAGTHPSISIGVAFRHIGEGLTEFYSRTDRSLYLAKSSGRNRVYCLETGMTLGNSDVDIDEIAWRGDTEQECGVPLLRKAV